MTPLVEERRYPRRPGELHREDKDGREAGNGQASLEAADIPGV